MGFLFLMLSPAGPAALLPSQHVRSRPKSTQFPLTQSSGPSKKSFISNKDPRIAFIVAIYNMNVDMLGQEWLFNCVCAYFFVLPEEGGGFLLLFWDGGVLLVGHVCLHTVTGKANYPRNP